LTVVLPKTRNDGGPVEDHEIWCFALESSVRQLGTALGLWQEVDGQLGAVLGDRDDTKGQDISVAVLNPCFALTRDDAARLNGRPVCDARVAGIGVGALGSQIVLNLARAGFGKWTLIDHDRLMPHNLARHALNGNFVGWNKADTVAYCADSITVEDNVFASLDADILRPGTKSEEVAATLTSAEVIADMTASVAAQRYLTRDVNSSARRLSIFLNPSGSDLVIIAEDAARKFPLDSLEMQYYRTLLHDTELAEHLGAPGVTQRYARSCGDTTSAIPQDFVGLHAAVASRALKDILSDSHPFVGIWRASADATVRRVNVDVAPVIEFHFNDWTVVLDRGLIDQLKRSREERLPNETGGVLLGSFDLQRRVLYVVDTLPSPPDSRERADLYIRGCEGLPKALEDAEARTAGMLEYIGEWHSHPAGASTKPSEYDLAAFSWLTKLMANDGLPAAMLIVGDTEIGLFIDSMGDEASPIPEEGRGKVLA